MWLQKNKKNRWTLFKNRKCLKAISSVKTKKITKPFRRKNINFWNHFFSSFWIIYTGHGYFIRTTHTTLIHKVWVDLINDRQQETHDLLRKKSELHGRNLLREQWVHPKNYNYLNPTQLLYLCCSVVQFIRLDIVARTMLWIVDLLCGSVSRN